MVKLINLFQISSLEFVFPTHNNIHMFSNWNRIAKAHLFLLHPLEL